jgi:GNAT superfamily N-acetyltransferase
MTDTIAYDVLTGSAARSADGVIDLCRILFPGFDGRYLTGRLGSVADPSLCRAMSGGRLTGFKLGYRRGDDLFYSWLGGVHPEMRGQGVARRLMENQHGWAVAAGYASVETRTRAANSAMIVLNLHAGFTITGFEVDRAGIAVVTQRKGLSA